MRCSSCSAESPPGSAFCSKCGSPLPAASKPATPADKLRGGPSSPSGNAESEVPLWNGGYSAKAMYGSWLFAALVSVAAVLASVLVPWPPTWLVAIAVVGVLWLALIVSYLTERLSVDYSLTTQRLVHRRGILNQVTDRIEVIDIDDVQYVQGIIERLFGVGSIKLLSSDVSDKALVMKGIDNVQQVANLIDNARREERRKRGIYMESV